MWKDDFIDLLTEYFENSKKKNPRFSLRAFAKKTGLSPGALSDTLKKKKKWRVSEKRALEILDLLAVSQAKKKRLLALMGKASPYPSSPLPPTDHKFLTDWTYLPILYSFDLPAPLAEPAKIAARLGLSEDKVSAVIEDLLKAKLLTRNARGKLTKEDRALTAGDGPGSRQVARHHALNLELAGRSLELHPSERRDFTSTTFSGSPKSLEYIRSEIRKLHQKVALLMDDDEHNDQVFRLSVQLFPMEFQS